jgi:hypothetical protein
MRAIEKTAATASIVICLILSSCSANQYEQPTFSSQLKSSTAPKASSYFTTESKLKTVDDILEDLIDSSTKIKQEFSDINHLNVSSVSFMSECCFKASHSPENLIKTRYLSEDLFPLDHNRVILNRAITSTLIMLMATSTRRSSLRRKVNRISKKIAKLSVNLINRFPRKHR